MFGMHPACGCCGCPLLEDDFNRANSSTISNGWTETAGNWEILSNELKIASSNATLSNTVSWPGMVGIKVKCRVKGTTNGDQIKLFYATPSSYILLTVGSSATVQQFINGGSARTCNVTAAANTYHTLEFISGAATPDEVYWSPSGGGCDRIYLNGQLIMFGRSFTAWSYANPHGVGVGTGTITTDAYFDDFQCFLMRHVDEYQTISRSAGGTSGGTWDIGNLPGGGSLTGLAHNITAAALKTALEGVLGSGNVHVTDGGFGFDLPWPYTIRFIGALGKTDHAMITASGANLSPVRTITVSEARKGVNCEKASPCIFMHMGEDSPWESILLTIGSVANGGFGGWTGCPGLNGTYTLDQMSFSDCSTWGTALSRKPCTCYGLDGLNIVLNTGSGSYTIKAIRAFQGTVNLIGWIDAGTTDTNLATFYFDQQSGSTIYPLCELTQFPAKELASFYISFGCTFTLSAITIEEA